VRYATFSLPQSPDPRLGIVNGDTIADVASLDRSGTTPASLLALVQAGPDAWRHVRDVVASATTMVGYPLTAVRLHAPIPRPTKNVICLGLNYEAHARESARARGREAVLPTVPVVFTKTPLTVTGPHDDVVVDRTATQQVDWEVELGVVIGVGGKNIARADALTHVFGYTVVNDLSARDLQHAHQQWFKGKSLDGFCPMGPAVVTADKIPDPQALRLRLAVNGVSKQDSNTSDMIFPVDALIEWLSKGMTLEPGDIIATGTPEGVGIGRTPQEFLNDGDVVETTIDGIGSLRNRIVFWNG
jgi:2-keto-4-pentenoate hydratase/2-oxohepta-3-ene-1,7-dioic acid hydratase in catechol pathway